MSRHATFLDFVLILKFFFIILMIIKNTILRITETYRNLGVSEFRSFGVSDHIGLRNQHPRGGGGPAKALRRAAGSAQALHRFDCSRGPV
jgi:hypothetical protein